MLKEINFHRLPCSRLVNRCITLFAFIACTWIGCWSVLGQNTPQETQPESKVVAASHTTPTTMFSQPATAPWEVLGSQPGYYHLQFSRLKDHPYIKANLLGLEIDESLTDLFRSEPNEAPSLKQFGISLEKITQLQGGIGFFYRFDPDQPSGNPYAVGFTMPKAEVTAINPVDWPSLIKALDFEKLQANFLLDSKVDSKVDVNAIRDTWLESAEKSRAYTFDTSMALGPSSSMPLPRPTETKKAMWETVSGGAATVLYDIVGVEAYPEDYQESDEVNRINHEMTVATETAAWGIDFSPDFLTHQVRFVAVPKDGVSADELLKKFEALKAAFARHPEYKDLPGYLREPFNNSKATIVQSTQRNGETTKPYLLIEGECTLTLAQFIDL